MTSHDAVHVTARTEQGVGRHPIFGEINVVQQVLVDQNGNYVPAPRLMELHYAGKAIGYCVKLKGRYLGYKGLPDLCVVEDVEPGRVKVGGQWHALHDFVEFYEPD